MSAAARERSCKVVALLRFEKKGGVGHKRGVGAEQKGQSGNQANNRINQSNESSSSGLKSATMQKALIHVRYLRS